MNQQQSEFYVRAVWDEEAGVYYSESDIFGFHIEAKTLDEFEELVREFAVDLIKANHLTGDGQPTPKVTIH